MQKSHSVGHHCSRERNRAQIVISSNFISPYTVNKKSCSNHLVFHPVALPNISGYDRVSKFDLGGM